MNEIPGTSANTANPVDQRSTALHSAIEVEEDDGGQLAGRNKKQAVAGKQVEAQPKAGTVTNVNMADTVEVSP